LARRKGRQALYALANGGFGGWLGERAHGAIIKAIILLDLKTDDPKTSTKPWTVLIEMGKSGDEP
jgi:hypothetical protein